MIIYMKKSYKKRSKKIKGGNQTKELENLNNLFLNRNYKLAITKDGKEEMYDVKYTGPQQNSQGAVSHKFSHIFKMQHSKFNTDSDLNSYSWKLLVPSISPQRTPSSNDREEADRSPEQGGGKKKRSRKRSTKKRARRRTRKAGNHTELAKAVMKRQFQKRAYRLQNTPGVIHKLQALPLDNPDADYADYLVVDRMMRQGQHVGMAAKRKEAKRKAAKEAYKRSQKRRKIDQRPKAIKMTGSFTLGNRGGRRKRKTRRRRRRRR